MRKGYLGVMLLICLVAGIPSDVWAQKGGKINFGKLVVIPGLAMQEVHDDNIFLTSGDPAEDEREISDWITHVIPSMLLHYTLDGRGVISAGYIGDYAYYKENDSNDWKNHTALFNFDYEGPGGLIAGIENTFVDAADPFGSENQYNLGVQTERWYDTLSAKLGYRFGDRLKVIGYANYYKQDYALPQDYTQDYKSQEVGLGVQMRLFSRTWGFVRYYYGERDYYNVYDPFIAILGETEETDADFTWRRLNVGLAWDPAGKLRGELNFGYVWEEPENALDPFALPRVDRESWIASTKINYAATATTTLSLTILRAFRDTGSNTNEYYKDTGASIGLTQELYYKLSLFGAIAYSINEFNLPLSRPREQDNYLFNVGLEYRLLDWLNANTAFTYNRKDSNYPEDEYIVNQFMVGLRAVY